MILGFIIGPLFEESLRQSVSVTGGSPAALLGYPIFVGFLVLALVSIWLAYAMIRRLKKQAVRIDTKSDGEEST